MHECTFRIFLRTAVLPFTRLATCGDSLSSSHEICSDFDFLIRYLVNVKAGCFCFAMWRFKMATARWLVDSQKSSHTLNLKHLKNEVEVIPATLCLQHLHGWKYVLWIPLICYCYRIYMVPLIAYSILPCSSHDTEQELILYRRKAIQQHRVTILCYVLLNKSSNSIIESFKLLVLVRAMKESQEQRTPSQLKRKQYERTQSTSITYCT